MFIHNINPVLLDLGLIEIRYYGLVYFIGFLVTYFWLIHLAKKGAIKNLTREAAENFMIYLIIGSIVGARVLDFVFYNPSVIWNAPLEILKFWNGGMSIHGGVIGGLAAYYFFRKKHNVKFYDLFDFIVIPLSFFLFLGRIANFINAELWGTVSRNTAICVDYSQNQYMANPPEGCRHPSQLYESLKNLLIFAVLMAMRGKERLKKGVLTWTFVTLYGVLRFIVNFWREDSRWLGISTGQWLSLAMVVAGTIFLIRIYLKGKEKKKMKAGSKKSKRKR